MVALCILLFFVINLFKTSSFTVGPKLNIYKTSNPVLFTNGLRSNQNDESRRATSDGLSFLRSNNNKYDEETVLILGGGFGGLYTALTLSTLLQSTTSLNTKSSSGMKIKLIDSKERFVFLPLLYELCNNKISLEEVAPTYKDLLKGSGVEFIQADVIDVDADLSAVRVTNSSITRGNNVIDGDACVKYDTLVIATGNAPPTLDKLELRLDGASTCSSSICTFYTIDDCYELRRRLAYLQKNTKVTTSSTSKKANIVIVGAGYSGVELACNLVADDKNNILNVTLVHKGSNVLSDATEYNRNNARNQLQKLGVNVMTDTIVSKVTNCSTQDDEEEDVTAYPPCNLHIQSNEENYEFQADLLIWTAGGGGGTANLSPSLQPSAKSGKIIVNSNLFIEQNNENEEDKRIYALGDISQLISPNSNQTKVLPQTAQKAIQQAYTVAWNIFSKRVNTKIITKLNEKNKNNILPLAIPMLPQVSFEFIELGEILTLGTKDATVSTLGGLVQINGTTGGLARRLIYSLRMPTWMQALLSTVKNLNRFLLLGVLSTLDDDK